jgi:hypothetical protein
MAFEEMRDSVEAFLGDERVRHGEPGLLVAIGHSKDLVDFEAIRRFLEFLRERGVLVTTFSRVFSEKAQPIS